MCRDPKIYMFLDYLRDTNPCRKGFQKRVSQTTDKTMIKKDLYTGRDKDSFGNAQHL